MAAPIGLTSGISRICLFQKIICPGTFSSSLNINLLNCQNVRSYKHWNPKFKRLRKLKVQKVELPNFKEDPDELSEEEVRSRLKEQGLLPPRPWVERPMFLSCTGATFEPYVPPEGDGKVSLISVPGAKQKFELMEKKSKSMMAVRKIRSFDEEFSTHIFAEGAQEIYINAHSCMASKNYKKLEQLVTERAYPLILHNSEDKTVHWKFIKSLEPPRVVHARCTDVVSKENIFAQLTVRFHTQQVLAVYDRFGRLMHGSEILAKDVLEYVVFEKHMANQYGLWRIHDKIIPDWMPPREPMERTYVKTEEPSPEPVPKTIPEKEVEKSVSNV